MNEGVTLSFTMGNGSDLEKTRKALKTAIPSAVPNFKSNRIFIPDIQNCAEEQSIISKLPGISSVAIIN